MKTPWIFRVVLGILWFLCPQWSFADYVIHLSSGRQFVTDRYWEEGNEIKFNYSGGVMGFPKDLIAFIEEKASPSPGETKDDQPAAEEPAPPQAPEKKAGAEKTEKKAEQRALQDLVDQKRVLKKQLDGALARLREASKNKDAEAKKKARAEMIDYSKQIYALTEEAKKLNNGQLPAGWWRD